MMTPFNPKPAAPAFPAYREGPQPGKGVRVTANAMGYSLSVSTRGAGFPHPFRPALGAAGLILSRGLVDGVFEPTIEGVPISGRDGVPQPILKLLPEVANKSFESWACLSVRPNANGELDKDSRIEIIHTHEPRSLKPEEGRCPLVQILWRENRPLRVFPIVYFNLRYTRVLAAPGNGAVRHLFY